MRAPHISQLLSVRHLPSCALHPVPGLTAAEFFLVARPYASCSRPNSLQHASRQRFKFLHFEFPSFSSLFSASSERHAPSFPGTIDLREIRRYQKSTELLIYNVSSVKSPRSPAAAPASSHHSAPHCHCTTSGSCLAVFG
ncbi:hypothetical protein K438DRAFT_25942 [Mycena galopus ATCC 62051]|nr:hypothetical protein K438DRAFT_25942 [Mycena galopus ATCC 62051]